jgi:hypothetical protein
MFTWICPQCGREVPPAYNDCPDCSRKTAEAAEPPPQPAAPQPGAAAPPAQQPPAPAPAIEPPVPAPQPEFRFGQHGEPLPPPRGLPTWLMTILFAAGFVAIVIGVYWAVSSSRRSSAANLSRPSANAENPAAKAGAPVHPLQKYIEIAGVRFQEAPTKKNVILVTFVVINHSPADVAGLAGNVTLWSNTRRSDEDAQGNFSFSTDLKGYASKELTVPLTTTKPAVELADWQYLSPDLQITAPAFSGGSLMQ